MNLFVLRDLLVVSASEVRISSQRAHPRLVQFLRGHSSFSASSLGRNFYWNPLELKHFGGVTVLVEVDDIIWE